MRRRAFWGGIVRLFIYLVLLAVPVWAYFTYLSPVIKQMDATISSVTGKKIQLEGQFAEFQKIFEQFQQRFGSTATSSGASQ